MDLRALEQVGEKLRNLQAWVIKSQSLVWMWIILAAVLLFIAGVVVICCIYRKELIRLWRACHSVHENSAHWRCRRSDSKSQDNFQDQIQELRKMILDLNKEGNDQVSVKHFNTVSTMVGHDQENSGVDDKSLGFLQ